MVYSALNTKRSFDLLQIVVFCVHRIIRSVFCIVWLKYVSESKPRIVNKCTSSLRN